MHVSRLPVSRNVTWRRGRGLCNGAYYWPHEHDRATPLSARRGRNAARAHRTRWPTGGLVALPCGSGGGSAPPHDVVLLGPRGKRQDCAATLVQRALRHGSRGCSGLDPATHSQSRSLGGRARTATRHCQVAAAQSGRWFSRICGVATRRGSAQGSHAGTDGALPAKTGCRAVGRSAHTAPRHWRHVAERQPASGAHMRRSCWCWPAHRGCPIT